MKAMFVNENGGIHYADAIVAGIKKIETRSRNVLWQLEGERVAVVKTHRNKKPMVVGYVRIVGKQFVSVEQFHKLFHRHLVPTGSQYDAHGKGKWCYYLAGAEKSEPYPLPKNAVRHGRSWCEWEEEV